MMSPTKDEAGTLNTKEEKVASELPNQHKNESASKGSIKDLDTKSGNIKSATSNNSVRKPRGKTTSVKSTNPSKKK